MRKPLCVLAGEFGLALLAAAAAFCVLPAAPDAFENPKRLVWCGLACALVVSGFFRSVRTPGPAVAATGWTLWGWMALRSFEGPFWRVAPPFVAWTLPLLLFLLSSRFRWSEGAVRRLVRTLALVGAAEAALMLCQRIGFDPLFGATTSAIAYAPGRMVGTIGYQNQAAEFLGIALVCALAGWRSPAVRIPAAVLFAGTILLTANRGASFALVALAAVYAIPRAVRSRRAFVRSAAAAVFVLALFLAVPQARSRLSELARPSRSLAVQSRIRMWSAALSLWRDHPVFGAGAGSYAHEYIDRLGGLLPERKGHADIRALVWAREAHCDPLQFAAEFGVAGIALGLLFLASLARALRRAAGAEWAAAAAFFLSCCSLFSFSWQTAAAAPATGLLLGMAAGSGAGGASREACAVADDDRPSFLLDVLSMAAAHLALFVVAVEAFVCNDADSVYRDVAAGDPPFLLRGDCRAKVAAIALRDGRSDLAAALCKAAEEEWMAPDLLVVEARALEAAGRGEEALAAWRRLERCGLWHDEALRGLSRCLERRRRLREAAVAEAERFRLWPNRFSDEEVYRLCALKTVAGDARYAEWISRRFRDRAAARGETEGKWTPEWANLRGGALLALGRNEEARECFEDAVRRKPGLVSARRNLQSVRAAERTGPGGDSVPDPRLPAARECPRPAGRPRAPAVSRNCD